MTPIQQYRITDNFIRKRGADRLEQFLNDLNKGLSVEDIARALLHVSTERGYILRNAIFVRKFVLNDTAQECYDNHIRSEQCKIERAVKFSNENKQNKNIRLIVCNQSMTCEKM